MHGSSEVPAAWDTQASFLRPRKAHGAGDTQMETTIASSLRSRAGSHVNKSHPEAEQMLLSEGNGWRICFAIC